MKSFLRAVTLCALTVVTAAACTFEDKGKTEEEVKSDACLMVDSKCGLNLSRIVSGLSGSGVEVRAMNSIADYSRAVAQFGSGNVARIGAFGAWTPLGTQLLLADSDKDFLLVEQLAAGKKESKVKLTYGQDVSSLVGKLADKYAVDRALASLFASSPFANASEIRICAASGAGSLNGKYALPISGKCLVLDMPDQFKAAKGSKCSQVLSSIGLILADSPVFMAQGGAAQTAIAVLNGNGYKTDGNHFWTPAQMFADPAHKQGSIEVMAIDGFVYADKDITKEISSLEANLKAQRIGMLPCTITSTFDNAQFDALKAATADAPFPQTRTAYLFLLYTGKYLEGSLSESAIQKLNKYAAAYEKTALLGAVVSDSDNKAVISCTLTPASAKAIVDADLDGQVANTFIIRVTDMFNKVECGSAIMVDSFAPGYQYVIPVAPAVIDVLYMQGALSDMMMKKQFREAIEGLKSLELIEEIPYPNTPSAYLSTEDGEAVLKGGLIVRPFEFLSGGVEAGTYYFAK